MAFRTNQELREAGLYFHILSLSVSAFNPKLPDYHFNPSHFKAVVLSQSLFNDRLSGTVFFFSFRRTLKTKVNQKNVPKEQRAKESEVQSG